MGQFPQIFEAAQIPFLFSVKINMASTLSGPNIEEEYMWTCTLSGSDKEYDWAPKEPQNDDTEDEEDGEDLDPTCKPNHRLLIKQAILHPEAKEGEVTMLQVETIGYNKQKIVAPIVAMKAGNDLQKYVDLLIPDAAKIKVISGSGPISLVGSHCVDFYDYRNYGAGQEDDDEEDEEDEEDAASSEDDAVDMEEQEAAAPPPATKGKSPKKSTPTKEGKKKSPSKAEDKEASPPKPAEKAATHKSAEKTAVTPGKKVKKEEAEEEAVKPASGGKKDKKRKASDEDAEGKKKRKGSGDK